MVLDSFIKELNKLDENLRNAMHQGIVLDDKPVQEITYSFKKKRENLCKNNVIISFNNINQQVWQLLKLHQIEQNKLQLIQLINLYLKFKEEFNLKKYENVLRTLNDMKYISKQLIPIPRTSNLSLLKPKLPSEISSEVLADIRELEKCYNANCLRSSVIICGRILETVLHRKYYEHTGFDILEKNPGIGLGKLIAKMQEKGIQLDPGLTQQIHLINNIRIFSVHKKKELFTPSKQQTYAIIHFTLDIVNKLF